MTKTPVVNVKEAVAKTIAYLKTSEGQKALEKVMKPKYGYMDPNSSACKRCQDSQTIRLCNDCPNAIRE